MIVDLKTAARRYTLQIETSLQLPVYSYAVGFGRFAEKGDVRLHFDGLTKTNESELHWYLTTRDRAANVRRLFRVAPEVTADDRDGSSTRVVGWQCKESSCRSPCWVLGLRYASGVPATEIVSFRTA